MKNMNDNTLNSNLILLIPTVFPATVVLFTYFKFQSDSINTRAVFRHDGIGIPFKFQSDSINTCTGNAFNSCNIL